MSLPKFHKILPEKLSAHDEQEIEKLCIRYIEIEAKKLDILAAIIGKDEEPQLGTVKELRDLVKLVDLSKALVDEAFEGRASTKLQKEINVYYTAIEALVAEQKKFHIELIRLGVIAEQNKKSNLLDKAFKVIKTHALAYTAKELFNSTYEKHQK